MSQCHFQPHVSCTTCCIHTGLPPIVPHTPSVLVSLHSFAHVPSFVRCLFLFKVNSCSSFEPEITLISSKSLFPNFARPILYFHRNIAILSCRTWFILDFTSLHVFTRLTFQTSTVLHLGYIVLDKIRGHCLQWACGLVFERD